MMATQNTTTGDVTNTDPSTIPPPYRTITDPTPFDSATAYARKTETYFNDGRESSLLSYLLSQESLRNKPQEILEAIGKFGRGDVETGLEGRFLMNVGSYKGKVVEGIVRGHWDDWSRPFPFDGNVDVKTGREDWESEDRGFTVVELGGYVGYSTILIAAALCERFGVPFGHKSADSTPSTRSVVPHLYTIELNPQFAQNVRDVVKFAGLSHVVTVVTARGDEGLKLLASGEWIRHCGSDNDSSEPEPINRIDILFIDHYKPAYTSDLKVAESLGLIQAPEKGRKGSILVADNVIVPGNPEYLAYVRRWGAPKGEDARAAESISTDAAPGQKPVYVSQQVISWEPTGERDGVEVSWCVGRAVPGVEANEDGAVKLS